MDTSREKATGPEGGASIRLRYSTQLPGNGRTNTIDAEISLPIGASPELREQIIREAELGVEQLARQLHQRGMRPADATRSQTPPRPIPEPPTTSRPAGNTRPPSETINMPAVRQATNPSLPATYLPVSQSMPLAPTVNSENKPIKLSQFISAIHKHLHISPTDAMRLLKVDTLDGLNYWDTYKQLQTILGQKNAETTDINALSRPTRSAPTVEPPRQASQPTPRPSINQTPSTRTQGQVMPKEAGRTDLRAAPLTSRTTDRDTESKPEINTRRPPESGQDFAGSPKSPIPIHIGVDVVRDAPTQPYQFDEEDEEEFDEDEEFEEEDEEEEDYVVPVNREQERASAQLKLDRLTSIRGSQTASAERLKVLDTLIASQISEEQLQTIIQAAWGASSKKKLKNAQAEELISWAKEDYFVEEAEAMLNLIQGEEE